MKRSLLLLLFLSLFTLSCASERDVGKEKTGKLIKMGWDSPTPDYIAANIREMEKQPFDGIRIKLNNWRLASSVFNPEKYPEEKMKEDFENLSKIKWGKFTDNFIGIITCKVEHRHQDWFNDNDWEAIVHNVRLASKAAKIGKCAGLVFDSESYGWSIWSYREAPHNKNKDFKEYCQQVRKRGKQFADAVRQEMPDARILMLVATEKILSKTNNGKWPSDAENCFEASSYALAMPFIEGMLDAAGGNFEIIDGNEVSYYYVDAGEYLNAAKRAHEDIPEMLLPEKSRDKWNRHFKIAQSVYLDEYFAMRKDRTLLSNFMDGKERLEWLEHNVYWAFKTTDKYVWMWDEGMNWWTSKGVPEGAAEAIVSGREKAETGKPLGFDFKAISEKALSKWEKEFLDKSKFPVTTQIFKMDDKDALPVIDGVFNDEVWKKAKPEMVLNQIYTRKHKTLHGKTNVQIACDSKNLYIKINCNDRLWEKNKNLLCFAGDSVNIILAEKKNIDNPAVITVEPNGKCSLMKNGQNYSLDSLCKIGTDSDGWTIESGIPFEKIFSEPPSGKIYANITRYRQDRGEISSWIPVLNKINYNCSNGIWIFGNAD